MHEAREKVAEDGFGIDPYFFALPGNAGKASHSQCAP
jgi:hypothetical protein